MPRLKKPTPDPFRDVLAKWIVRARFCAGGAKAMAEKIGITRVTVWNLEKGSGNLSLWHFLKMCQAAEQDPSQQIKLIIKKYEEASSDRLQHVE